jgi:hypothetical protein
MWWRNSRRPHFQCYHQQPADACWRALAGQRVFYVFTYLQLGHIDIMIWSIKAKVFFLLSIQ